MDFEEIKQVMFDCVNNHNVNDINAYLQEMKRRALISAEKGDGVWVTLYNVIFVDSLSQAIHHKYSDFKFMRGTNMKDDSLAFIDAFDEYTKTHRHADTKDIIPFYSWSFGRR